MHVPLICDKDGTTEQWRKIREFKNFICAQLEIYILA